MQMLQFQETFPLSKQECFFKSLAKDYGSYCIFPGDSQFLLRELDKINPAFSLEILPESNFIADGYDVAVLKHGRYTPALSHSHDFIEIVYVVNGICTNYINTVPMTLCQGDVCIIGKHTPHALGVFDDNCVCYNLMIRSSTFERVFLGLLPRHDILSDFIMKTLYADYENSYLCFPTGTDKRILSQFNGIYNEYLHSEPYSSAMLNTMVSTFFITLLRHYSALAITSNPVKKNSVNRNISAILYYMQQHYDTITLKGLADFSHYSERHLGRLLKEYTGFSYTALLQQIRLNKAAALLKDSSFPVTEIVYKIGYTDFGFFYKIFKTAFHITPAEYRKQCHTLSREAPPVRRL